MRIAGENSSWFRCSHANDAVQIVSLADPRSSRRRHRWAMACALLIDTRSFTLTRSSFDVCGGTLQYWVSREGGNAKNEVLVSCSATGKTRWSGQGRLHHRRRCAASSSRKFLVFVTYACLEVEHATSVHVRFLEQPQRNLSNCHSSASTSILLRGASYASKPTSFTSQGGRCRRNLYDIDVGTIRVNRFLRQCWDRESARRMAMNARSFDKFPETHPAAPRPPLPLAREIRTSTVAGTQVH